MGLAPCIAHRPNVLELAKKYAHNNSVEILMISMDADKVDWLSPAFSHLFIQQIQTQPVDNKRTVVEELIPLYKLDSKVLIGLKIDYPGDMVDDGLVLEIDVKEERIINDPWSGQKKLKFGYYDSVNANEKSILLDLIADKF